MFQLTEKEWRELVTNCDRLPMTIKHSFVLPSAFTQEGVASLSGVLKIRGCLTSFRQPLFHGKLVYSNISEAYFSEFSDKSCRIK